MIRIRCLFLAAALAASSAFAQAPADERVKVGREMKRTIGTVTKLVNGDIACYMEMRDDKGVAFQESADFEICFQKPSLVGKRVRLAYRMSRVLAASCQGDVDCKKSDTIALVVSATVIGGVVAQAKPAAGAASHCTSAEEVVFSCRTGTNIVSVCASRQLSPTTGYVQYRFGKPGEKPDMALPEGQVHPRRALEGENVPFAGGGGVWLRFRNGPVAYVVYSGIGRWGPGGSTAEKQGVVVEKNGKHTANVKCAGPRAGELSPDWFEKAGIPRNPKEDFLFPD